MSDQISDGAEYHLRKAGQLYRAATAERDRLKAELAKLQAEREQLKAKLVGAMTGEMDSTHERDKLASKLAELQSLIGGVEGVFRSSGESEAVLEGFLSPDDSVVDGVKLLATCYRNVATKLELAQDERETIDNGDGTVTAWKPVTFLKSLDVSEVRAPKKGELFAGYCGVSSANANSDFEAGTVRLILRPAPKPPEPVTWEAPLVDGKWTADEEWFGDQRSRRWTWDSTGSIICGLAKPAKLGTYQFRNGVGTLIEAAQ